MLSQLATSSIVRSVAPSRLLRNVFARMSGNRPVVNTTCGKLRGTEGNNVLGGTYFAFRGIPFAEPPIGNLRFADPVPVKPWSDVRDASKFGDNNLHMSMFLREVVGTEDCLYLNVYTKSIDKGSKLPVMFSVHGGAFCMGSGDDDFFGPDFLVRKDVVLVTINYRLGVFGFLSVEDEAAPGNQGLKDQVLALKWVRDNISNFGGDPNNVTIFGESAGAASIHYLTLSPTAEGLYHKAILQSGVATNPWASTESPRRIAIRLAQALGLNSTDPKKIVEFLRSVDARALFDAAGKIATTEEKLLDLPTLLCPSVDDKSKTPFLPQPLVEAVKVGFKVPVMMGFTDREGLIFVSGVLKKESSLEAVDKRFTEIYNPEVLPNLKYHEITGEELRKIYLGEKPLNEETFPKYVDLMEDLYFYRGIYDIARKHLTANPQVPLYLYKFSNSKGVSMMKHMFHVEMEGTSHGDELAMLFLPHIAKDAIMAVTVPGSPNYDLMTKLTQMWTDFAKFGNPTPAKTNEVPVTWEPAKNGPTLNLLHIDVEPKMTSDKALEDRIQWKRLTNKL